MAKVAGKAWIYDSVEGGMIDNLRLADHFISDQVKDHVLIEILNVSLNPGDYKFPLVPIIGRFIKYPASPAFDFCGRIRALPISYNKDKRDLMVGQVVWGMHKDLKTSGTLKTVLWVHKDSLWPLPSDFPVEHGSALGCAALTAVKAIKPYAKSDARVLITAGSGGCGSFAIQVAKAYNMYVIATCSEAGAQLCKDLGADEVLDYKSSTYLDELSRVDVDLVVDNVGNDPQLHYRSRAFLKPNGVFVLVATMVESWQGVWSMTMSFLRPTWLGGIPRRWTTINVMVGAVDYAEVADLARKGKLHVAVEKIYPFEEVPEAFRRMASGRVKGKVLVDVGSVNKQQG